jgi:hypothetical protein
VEAGTRGGHTAANLGAGGQQSGNSAQVKSSISMAGNDLNGRELDHEFPIGLIGAKPKRILSARRPRLIVS